MELRIFVVETTTNVVGYFDTYAKAQQACDVLCSMTSRPYEQSDLSISEFPLNQILEYGRPPCAYIESEQMTYY